MGTDQELSMYKNNNLILYAVLITLSPVLFVGTLIYFLTMGWHVNHPIFNDPRMFQILFSSCVKEVSFATPPSKQEKMFHVPHLQNWNSRKKQHPVIPKDAIRLYRTNYDFNILFNPKQASLSDVQTCIWAALEMWFEWACAKFKWPGTVCPPLNTCNLFMPF